MLAWLMVSIHVFVEHHLGDAQLSPAAVAAAHRICVRYLHRLFQLRGISVSAWIGQRRLEWCRRDLGDPVLAELPVRVVAARWGLRPEEFSKAFRVAYGTASRDCRRLDHHPE
jgi:AraC-like DNA-binding protein